MSAPVLIMAGGTGGHIFPGLAVAEVLRTQGVPVQWLGAEGGMETQIVPRHGLALHALPVRGLRGKGLRARIAAPWMLLRALFGALALVRRLAPRCVLSMGGYAAGPGGLAAWLLGVPLLVHEQNRVPGLTNRILARLARRVLCGFPDAFPRRPGVQVAGNPVRAEIASLPVPKQRFSERNGPLRLLVLGGSQGAAALNRAVPEALAAVPARWEVRHQCGGRFLEATRAAYARAGRLADVRAFIDDMAEVYAWADLVICRAGALTIAELTAAGLGALLVPYPHAVDDHQSANAALLVGAGAAECVAETDDLAARLGEALARLGDRGRLLEMATRARALARPDAAEAVARACLEEART